MRKVLIGSAIVLAIGLPILGAIPAQADEPTPGASSKPHHNGDEEDQTQDSNLGIIDPIAEDRLHHEINERYGNKGAFQIPPLVIRPNSDGVTITTDAPKISGNLPGASISGAGLGYSGGQTPANSVQNAGIRPNGETNVAEHPVDFKLVNLNEQSPAQQFFQVSTIGLGVLAAGAVVLGGTIGARAWRQARADSRSDYYDNV